MIAILVENGIRTVPAAAAIPANREFYRKFRGKRNFESLREQIFRATIGLLESRAEKSSLRTGTDISRTRLCNLQKSQLLRRLQVHHHLELGWRHDWQTIEIANDGNPGARSA
jgi:hypothetical protein